MNIFASNFYTAYMAIPRYRIYKRKSPWPTITLLKKSKDYTPQETRSIECASLKMYMIFHLLLIKRGARSWWNGSTFLRCKIFWLFTVNLHPDIILFTFSHKIHNKNFSFFYIFSKKTEDKWLSYTYALLTSFFLT